MERIDRFLLDLRYAVRQLRRRPAVTAAVVAILGLAIGANTAIFTIVHAVLLAPLPYQDSDRLVELSSSPDFHGASYPDLRDWQALRADFDDVTGYLTRAANLDLSGQGRELTVAHVSPSFFTTFGVQPSPGAPLPADEDAAAIVLSQGLWIDAFGRDPGVVGSPVRIDGLSYRVAGIMPPGFAFPTRAVDAWLPLRPALSAEPYALTSRGVRKLGVVARLGHGVTLDRARGDLAVLYGHVISEITGGETGPSSGMLVDDAGFGIRPLRDTFVGPGTRRALARLTGAVALVLLLACANAAILLLGRAAERRQEVAVRLALGASRRALLAELLLESLLLAGAAAVLGMALARAGLIVLLRAWPEAVPAVNAISLDSAVVVFTLGLAGLTSLAFGLLPALQVTQQALERVLRDETPGGGRARSKVQGALIVGQVATTFVLLLVAGLLVKSLSRLLAVDPGFDRDATVVARLRLDPARYPGGVTQADFFRRLVAAVEQRPDVASAAIASTLPFTGEKEMTDLAWFNPGDLRPSSPIMVAIGSTVSPAYFSAMQLRLRAGRTFDEGDATGAARVVVINQSLAHSLWPGGDAVGRELPLDNLPRGPGRPARVVGVVDDVHAWSLEDRDGAPAQLYLAMAQDAAIPQAWIVVRATRPDRLPAIAAAVRGAVAELDPHQPIGELASLRSLVERDTAGRRLDAALLGVFAVLALVLVVAGVASVASYAVSQRTREIGIRLALGSKPADVVRLLVRESLVRVGAGLAGGALGALLAARALRSVLFGVGVLDPLIYAGCAVLLLLVAFVATWLPARRSHRISPLEALRSSS